MQKKMQRPGGYRLLFDKFSKNGAHMYQLTALEASEIEALLKDLPIENLRQSEFITTADLRPIDRVVGPAKEVCNDVMKQALLPYHVFSGEVKHPPIAMTMRKYYPEEKHEGWTEPYEMKVSAIKAISTEDAADEGWLLIAKTKDASRSSLWGMNSKREFVFYRGLEQVFNNAIELLKKINNMDTSGFKSLLEQKALNETTDDIQVIKTKGPSKAL